MTGHGTLDFRNYVQSVGIATPHILPLARKLANAAPPDADPSERAALERVAVAAAGVGAVLSERDRFAPARVRPFFLAFANGWSAFHGALDALASVPPHVSARGTRAAELRATLFPDGVAFVRLDAFGAWSEGYRRLDRIESEGLKTELEQLVGADIVAAATTASQKLAEAIGVTPGTQEPPAAASLRDARVKFSKAVAAYCRILSAKVDEDDAASIARFSNAVAPVDELRIIRERGGEEEDEPVGPVIEPVAPTPA